MRTTPAGTTRILPEAQWAPLARDHELRVDELTTDHLARRLRHEPHATEDFLWDYYSYRPGQLRRWHPGVGSVLAGPAADEYLDRRWYVRRDSGVGVDLEAFLAAKADTVEYIHTLLTATEAREAQFSCFCLHEWAMVYQLPETELRHRLPLRLGSAATDAVVDAHPMRCSHFDAFRYFTPAARPLNAQLTRADQTAMEQPGCLHATMDLYKWAYKLSPAISSDVVLEAFILAKRTRDLDMAASPYDASSLGLEAVPIETPKGKIDFNTRQREIVTAGQRFRSRLAVLCAELLEQR